MRKVCLLAVAGLLLSACRLPPDGNPVTVAAKRDPVGSWQRQKECSEQADRIAKRLGFDDDRTDVLIYGGRSNHYSPTYEKCYVRVRYNNLSRDLPPGSPRSYVELWDAFEDREVASCSPGLNIDARIHCINVEQGSSGDCDACGRFIEERMTK